MNKFEILCVTMNQKDFSKIDEMNVNSNIVYANQCDETKYDEIQVKGFTAKMISTQTRGVGINRNIALMYATGDICLLSDDDVVYNSDVETVVLQEFANHPDADIIIFHFETNDEKRQQVKYKKTKKHGRFARMPWGAIRVAFRLTSIIKKNIWFTTLFGGGCKFPSGEDSMWLMLAKKKGLKFYVSNKTIGTVSFEKSTWFSGYDEKYYYGRGAFFAATHRRTFLLRCIYIYIRTKKMANNKFSDILKWMKAGKKDYLKLK